MLQIWITINGEEVDYTRYVDQGSLNIQHQLNVASTCQLTFQNVDARFRLFPKWSYLRIASTKYVKNLFTGYLQNDPTVTYNGMSTGAREFQFQSLKFQCTFSSDESLLNTKAVPLVPAFVNQSQGAILRQLGETLCPGFFDYTHCASGDIVPYLAYDPSQTWSAIAKNFCDQARFRYRVINREVHFQPYGDGALGLRYDERTSKQRTFDPQKLTTSATTTKIVNDVIVIGQQEAGNNHEDFFIGDGFTGAFPLKHKVFGLADAQQGSGLLLNESWNSTDLNAQTWVAQDPSQNFYYGADNTQQLNILTPLPQDLGTSFIVSKNAVELAGGVSIQHGEFVFNDTCTGNIGALFDATVLDAYGNLGLDESNQICAFRVTPTQNVYVTASGASGVKIAPYRNGAEVPNSFEVVTKVNKSYVLFTNIAAPVAARVKQVFRSMAGIVFNSTYDTSDVIGSITWNVVETDQFTGQQTFYNYTLGQQTLPASAIYALIDNQTLNLNVWNTVVSVPVPATLHANCEIGAGQLGAIYVSGTLQYTGAFVTPSGGNLPILPENLGPENQFALGTSLGPQSAEVDSGTSVDTVNFYGDDVPGVGVRIRFQSHESQAAISRVRDTDSVANEAAVVGDDGVRSIVVSDLKPLPRTSEDCEAAAQAYLADRVSTFYEGSYTASSAFFFQQNINDIEYFPVCGRYLFIDAPQRNIAKQNMLVSQVTISCQSLRDEVLTYNIGFGPDLSLNKLLGVLLPQPDNVLYPIDTSIQPDPQALDQLGTYTLPDVRSTSILTRPISGAQFSMDFLDEVPVDAYYEVRNSDLNWGRGDARLIKRVYANGPIIFPRNGYDESWFIRLVNTTGAAPISSRRTKVIRIAYPRIPSAPMPLVVQSDNLQFDFSGDTRNISGMQVVDAFGTVYYETIVGSRESMNLDLNALRGQNLDDTFNSLGEYLLQYLPASLRSFSVRFFNLMWEFGPTTTVAVPTPLEPLINIGYRFGPSVQVLVTDRANRTDIASTRLQLANDPSFAPQFILVDSTSSGIVGSYTNNVPISGDIYARAYISDYIGPSVWSATLHVPRGNLIASDYMVGQGSVPPSIVNATTASGGIFTYSGTSNSLTLSSTALSIYWPNGTIDTIPALTQVFNHAIGNGGANIPLFPSTTYGFFPSVFNPQTPHPTMSFNGPYANYAGADSIGALTTQVLDGSTPLTNGAFVCQTAAATVTGQSGGGGGGSYGGGSNCGVLSSVIVLNNGREIELEQLEVNMVVKTFSGRGSKVQHKTILLEDTYVVTTENGFDTTCAGGHTLFADDVWRSVADLYDAWKNGEIPVVNTIRGPSRIESIHQYYLKQICKLELQSLHDDDLDADHVYLLDGFWTHNVMVKAYSNEY